MPSVSSVGILATRVDPEGFAADLDRLAALGADHVEINVAALGVIVGGRLRRETLRPFTRALAAHDLGVTVHGPLSLDFTDRALAVHHDAVARATVDACQAVAASRLVVHPPWVEGFRLRTERDHLLALEREGLHALAERAATASVLVCLENMPPVPESLTGTLLNHGLDCESVRDQVVAVAHPNLWATLDVSHAYIASGYLGRPFRQQLEALAPVARHLHLHDSFGRLPALPRPMAGELLAYGVGDLHLPLGWGTLPWDDALSGLPLPDDASATLEIPPAYATRETLGDSLARARAALALTARPQVEAAD